MSMTNGAGNGVTSVDRSSYTASQRILRGYGPAAALLLVIVLIAVTVPSKAQKANNAAAVSSSGDTVDTSGGGGATNSAAPAAGAAASGSAGSAGQAATGGKTVTLPGKTTACTGQALQVPGDPYSPPCIQFTGDNGGATSKGVTKDSITMAVRLTADQSFQQTLAQLAGAQLRDTNDDNVRTINALAQYFNTHYQFYGRKITVQTFSGQGSLANELQGNGQAAA